MRISRSFHVTDRPRGGGGAGSRGRGAGRRDGTEGRGAAARTAGGRARRLRVLPHPSRRPDGRSRRVRCRSRCRTRTTSGRTPTSPPHRPRLRRKLENADLPPLQPHPNTFLNDGWWSSTRTPSSGRPPGPPPRAAPTTSRSHIRPWPRSARPWRKRATASADGDCSAREANDVQTRWIGPRPVRVDDHHPSFWKVFGWGWRGRRSAFSSLRRRRGRWGGLAGVLPDIVLVRHRLRHRTGGIRLSGRRLRREPRRRLARPPTVRAVAPRPSVPSRRPASRPRLPAPPPPRGR